MIRLLLGLALAATTLPAQSDRVEKLERVVETQRKLIRDWGGLTRYGSEDTELPPPTAGENRVVFFGDDVTDNWDDIDPKFFIGKPYINRGIAGQSSPQMLVRFRQDVIALQPKVVVIQTGMNDIAAVTVPGTQGMIAEQVKSMVDLAHSHGIAVVLASLLPVCDCGNRLVPLLPRGKIFGLNDWLEEFAKESGSVYLNYYKALADERDFKRELTKDGVLPNEKGYAVMAPLAETAIAGALQARSPRER